MQALSSIKPDVTVETLNVFSGECSLFPLTLIPRLYSIFTQYPLLWKTLFYFTNKPARFSYIERLVQPLILPGFYKKLQQIKPDVIISIFPALGFTIHQAIKKLGRSIPFGVIIIDLVTVHPAWIFQCVDWYVVQTEEAVQVLEAEGIPLEKIHLMNLPIRNEFNHPRKNPNELREELGLPLDKHIILLIDNGSGSGRIEKLVPEIQLKMPDSYLVIITGKNKSLRQRLIAKFQCDTNTILGFVDNIADWMYSADVLITKAGPSVILEAVQCNLPLVIFGAIPGQEEGNILFVKKAGIGIIAESFQEAASSAQRIITDIQLSEDKKLKMKQLYNSQSSSDIVNLILGKEE
jgi:processive 1,2-diacylglycerol beta-glucosyltransferase